MISTCMLLGVIDAPGTDLDRRFTDGGLSKEIEHDLQRPEYSPPVFNGVTTGYYGCARNNIMLLSTKASMPNV